MSTRTVYVAEAYKDGKRIEQIVHWNRRDAWEDIEIMTDDPDKITVNERHLYLGRTEEIYIER